MAQGAAYFREDEGARVGKGEQGVLLVEPYMSKILPHWGYKTAVDARKSSAKIYKMFLD